MVYVTNASPTSQPGMLTDSVFAMAANVGAARGRVTPAEYVTTGE
jgi:hypothetical protein